jgi:hypothetical protein
LLSHIPGVAAISSSHKLRLGPPIPGAEDAEMAASGHLHRFQGRQGHACCMYVCV